MPRICSYPFVFYVCTNLRIKSYFHTCQIKNQAGGVVRLLQTYRFGDRDAFRAERHRHIHRIAGRYDIVLSDILHQQLQGELPRLVPINSYQLVQDIKGVEEKMRIDLRLLHRISTFYNIIQHFYH